MRQPEVDLLVDGSAVNSASNNASRIELLVFSKSDYMIQ